MKIYLATSWRNAYHSNVLQLLIRSGYDVYDFKNPGSGKEGFSWEKVDKNWKNWDQTDFVECLYHPIARDGFFTDFDAMRSADVCVLLLPSGRSAHLEAGWMAGYGKPVVAYLPEKIEPELMYGLVTSVVTNTHWLLSELLTISHKLKK